MKCEMRNIDMEKLKDIKQTTTFNTPIKTVWDKVSTSEGMAA